MKQIKLESIEVSVPLPLRYLLKNVEAEGMALLFLHGYTDSGTALLRRIFDEDLPDYPYLAPNGVFPVPVRVATGFKEAYAWYFSDPDSPTPLVPGETAAAQIEVLLEHLGWVDRELLIVGFSQGGFLAPLVARRCRKVRGILTIGSGFRKDWYDTSFTFPIRSIHGEDDDIVRFSQGKKGIKALEEMGLDVKMQAIPAMGHTINEDGASAIRAEIEKIRNN